MLEVETCLRESCREAGLEARHFFCCLQSASSGVQLQASAAEPAEHLCRLLQARFPRLQVQVALLPTAALRDRRGWVMASVADVRRDPIHTAEQTTQALQGEVVEPLLHEEGWLLSRLSDGYIGWIRDWHLSLVTPDAAQAHAERADARVAVPLATLRQAPEAGAQPCAETLMGTPVQRRGRRAGWAEIEIPGGRSGWVEEKMLREGVAHWPAEAGSVLGMLRQFLGVPYVWGGKSPKGFDCSGLVQFVYGLHGIALPRDSDEQSTCGHEVDAFTAADLLFFGSERVTHVGVALDARDFLHARGTVRHDALAPDSPRYAADLAGILRVGGRVLPHLR